MAKVDFLSDEWFSKVKELREAAGELDIPAIIQDLVLNVTVTDGDKAIDMCMNAGSLQQGHVDGAATKMTLPKDLALRLFIENDKSAGMQGFMAGQIKIEGDMSKMMAMQSVEATPKQEELRKTIVEITNA